MVPLSSLLPYNRVRRVVAGLLRPAPGSALSSAALVAVLIGSSPGVALAHPHVFLENHVVLRFDGRLLTGFDFVWRFDEVFSATMLDSLGLTDKAPWSADTVAAIQRDGFDNLVNYDYFVHVMTAAGPVKVTAIRNFAASMSGERLVFQFTADLASAVDSSEKPIRAGFFDHTYYVDVGFPDAAAIDTTQAPPGCRINLTLDTENPIYSGTVYPQTVLIQCPRS
ncbi:MAG: DUF1007 family protein [Azospirillaceae bacterium]|nr:DUF1007 family protein [Azospirillaceae bacterium]